MMSVTSLITPTPILQIFVNSTGNIGLSIFLNTLATYNALVGGVTGLGSCSRVMWAMSRDGCFPESFRGVHPKLDVPIQSILVSWAPMLAIGAIYIGTRPHFTVS